MPTIQDNSIEKPVSSFHCKVLRAACNNVYYTPERWEDWIVLAQTEAGAKNIAEYHFFRSNPENIIITNQL